MTSRRRFLATLAAIAAPPALPSANAQAPAPIATRPVPSTREPVPLVGLGTWITFNVGNDAAARERCTEVVRAFLAGGGRVIDSSPMYGSSQAVVGDALARLGRPASVFAADKVWIAPGRRGPAQIEASRALWGVARFDLLQVHNLLAWDEHLPTLFAMKAAGTLRYVGITTSHGRRHDDVESIMRRHPIDFVQVSYSVADREVEQRILPLAQERGIAVIANRPFRQGDLLRDLAGRPLPPWATEAGAATWAQFALRFAIAHPAVTCAIPATSRVDHVRENLACARAPLPDEPMRRRMAAHVGAL